MHRFVRCGRFDTLHSNICLCQNILFMQTILRKFIFEIIFAWNVRITNRTQFLMIMGIQFRRPSQHFCVWYYYFIHTIIIIIISSSSSSSINIIASMRYSISCNQFVYISQIAYVSFVDVFSVNICIYNINSMLYTSPNVKAKRKSACQPVHRIITYY